MNLARWAPVSGVLYVLLWVVAFFAFDDDAGDSDAEIVSWYADSGNRDKDFVAFFVILATSLLFIWFLGVLRGRMADAEGSVGTRTAMAFGAGLVAVTMWTIAITIWISTSFAVDDADEFVVDPNTNRLVDTLGYGIWVSGTTIALIVVLCAALVGLQGRLMPRWLAWLGLLVAATMVASFMFLPFFAWLGWVLVLSLVMLFWKPNAAGAAPAGTAD